MLCEAVKPVTMSAVRIRRAASLRCAKPSVLALQLALQRRFAKKWNDLRWPSLSSGALKPVPSRLADDVGGFQFLVLFRRGLAGLSGGWGIGVEPGAVLYDVADLAFGEQVGVVWEHA